jgi:hypothetical protein
MHNHCFDVHRILFVRVFVFDLLEIGPQVLWSWDQLKKDQRSGSLLRRIRGPPGIVSLVQERKVRWLRLYYSLVCFLRLRFLDRPMVDWGQKSLLIARLYESIPR